MWPKRDDASLVAKTLKPKTAARVAMPRTEVGTKTRRGQSVLIDNAAQPTQATDSPGKNPTCVVSLATLESSDLIIGDLPPIEPEFTQELEDLNPFHQMELL